MKVNKKAYEYTDPYDIPSRGKDLGPNRPLNPPKMRACRKCGVDTHRYYLCPTCATYWEEKVGGWDSYGSPTSPEVASPNTDDIGFF